MKKIFSLAGLAMQFAVLAQDIGSDTLSGPVISKPGIEKGIKASAIINKQGGQLVSSDGIIELNIPEGALSKKTEISIQPITNTMPNGNGFAYRLEPSGIQFKKKVEIIFHYDEEYEKDSMPYLLGIAMQGENGQWSGLKNFALDINAKTIRGYIAHFSDWSSFSSIKINPASARVRINNTQTLQVIGVLPEPQEEDDNMLVALVREPKKVTWKVNNITGGNASVGMINGRMKGSYYSAPSAIPAHNPVAVTAHLDGMNIPYNGITFKDLRLVSNLLIYDNAYEVTMITKNKGNAGTELGECNYNDQGSFIVSLESGKAEVIEKLNNNVVDELGYNGRCRIVLLKPGRGNIHITGVKKITLIPPASPQANAWIEIQFIKTPVMLSLLQITCPPTGPGGATTITTARGNALASLISAHPIFIKFEAKEGEQTILRHGEEGTEIYARFTVKKLKD